MNSILSKYRDILDNFEDLEAGGYRREHGTETGVLRLSGRANPEEASAQDLSSCSLEELAGLVRRCSACPLGSLRKNAVPGDGSSKPEVMLIGEAPGGQEDESGKPFVGAAGKYLDKWLDAVHLSRDRNVFIANVIKCRPPGNRDPEESEMKSCFPYLLAQIELLKPRAILCLGRFAGRKITGMETSLRNMREKVHYFQDIPVIVTYHPSAVLRNPELRRPVWDDLRRLSGLIGQG
ncbi:uracil-DNA glycosylase [Marispirochaeta aestuarii]|uniref:uracil-DNA glycosylase n=1 Tax=Marispirochaeta aestuarii TaxID=1963862 RepID=UPI002ABDF236|nr:uracil-DNA glycosylase [Marispirochaeta aestuarii]